MISFCTITTAAYFPLAKTLFASLHKQHPGCLLHVLITDDTSVRSEGDIRVLSFEDIKNANFFSGIQRKYAYSNNADQLRWALKPILIGHLLQNGYTKVVFTDPDIFFVGQAGFITAMLDTYAVMLTPHWADMDIMNNEDSIISILKGGLYNAGFVAASQKGLPAIHWWAGMCHYKTEKRPDLGIYDDQKYLDMLPVQFENVHILKHQGCNLASWNIQTCKREMVNGKFLINKKFEPVFIHFAKDTIANILNRNDALLKPYLDEYIQLLSDNGFDLLKNLHNISPGKYDSAFYKLKHGLRLRTRLKRFFYKLAEKL